LPILATENSLLFVNAMKTIKILC